MSPPIETGCSEVSTTVTLLDGNTSAIKDDSSRSTTTSPIIEPSREHEKNTDNSFKHEGICIRFIYVLKRYTTFHFN